MIRNSVNVLLSLATGLVLAAASVTPAAAFDESHPPRSATGQSRPIGEQRRERPGRHRMLTREAAVRLALREHGGRVLSVRLVDREGELPFYRIKLLREGNVRIVRIRARR